MNGVVLASGAAVGIGSLLIVRGLFPPRIPLDRLLNPPSPPAPREEVTAGRWASQVGVPLAPALAALGLPTKAIRRDLAVLDRSVSSYLGEKVASGLGLALVFPCFPLVASLLGFELPLVVIVWVGVLAGALGFFLPDFSVRSEAAKVRGDFLHALSAFLDLTVACLAGGSGVDGALTDAATIGHGPAFTRLRRALETARLTQQPAWGPLGDLGTRLDVPELRELCASVLLAEGEGAKVRASLSAKAAALRTHLLADAETKATAATERMALPLVVLFAGLLVFLDTPAVLTFLSTFN
jgi:tight adherence protein C